MNTTISWEKCPPNAAFSTLLIPGRAETHTLSVKWVRNDRIRICQAAGSSLEDILARQGLQGLALGSKKWYFAIDAKDQVCHERDNAIVESSMDRLIEKINRLFPGKMVELDFGDRETDFLPKNPPDPDQSWVAWWASLTPEWKTVFTRKFPALAKKAAQETNR